MKLLFDENLSRRLVPQLSDLFPGSAHLSTVDLLHSPDREIWKFAAAEGFCIVTADADFFELSGRFGPPPKVIWLRHCDYPTGVAERLLRRQAIRIGEFGRDAETGVLSLVYSAV